MRGLGWIVFGICQWGTASAFLLPTVQHPHVVTVVYEGVVFAIGLSAILVGAGREARRDD